ncbi:hypothetical protein SAMN05216436_10543 [bacterium A37T11]|nr:hypothetical protein SAMN05216436_10543 [bacterium A37T11]
MLGDRTEKEEVIASRIESHTQPFKNSVSPLIYSIDYINQSLRDGQYFFIDIIREGILLYDTGKAIFAEPKILKRNCGNGQFLNDYFS